MSDATPRYELLRPLAQGGMGVVFLARQRASGGFSRLVVAKRTRSMVKSEKELSEMLHREAQLTALLNHPNVAQVLDFEEIDSARYLIMEAIEGPSASELVARGGPVPPELVSYIGTAIAD